MTTDMFVVDSHCDSIQTVDNRKYGVVNPYNFSKKYKQLQFVALFCGWPKENADQSYKRAMRYIGEFTIAMQKEKDSIVQVRTYSDIENALNSGKHAALLSVEGGGMGIKGDISIFDDFYTAGVRVFGIAWKSNDLAKSNRVFDDGEEDTGLSELGRAVVEEGNRLGMIFDVSHLSDKSFWDLAEISKKPIIASHSNFRTLCGHSRNLTDDMAREIARQDGMIGLNLCTSFVDENPEKRTVARLFEHLDYCLGLIGEDHIGFGGDIDGVDGIYPSPLTTEDSIHDQLIEFMERHNYPETLIEKVAYKNYLAFLKKYL